MKAPVDWTEEFAHAPGNDEETERSARTWQESKKTNKARRPRLRDNRRVYYEGQGELAPNSSNRGYEFGAGVERPRVPFLTRPVL